MGKYSIDRELMKQEIMPANRNIARAKGIVNEMYLREYAENPVEKTGNIPTDRMETYGLLYSLLQEAFDTLNEAMKK